MDADALFHERWKRFSVEFVRYAQYVANGGVLFVAIFLCGLLAYSYPGIIGMIPPWFPIPYFLAFVIAVFVTRSPHRTFLLEADLLFLTPIETKMASYFQKAQVYNFFVQGFGVFLILLLLLPLYLGTMKAEGGELWFYWGVPLVLKGWNVYSSWIFLRLPDKKKQQTYSLARYFFSFLVLAWVLSEGGLFTYRHVQYGGIVCILFIIWFHLRLKTIRKSHSLQWYRLLEIENGLRGRFHSVVNQFKDVPWLQHQVKARTWLAPVMKLVPYHPANAARLLVLKTFIRSGDFAGVYVRLVVLGSFLVLILSNPYAKLSVALLFLLMSGSQLKGIWSHHQNRRGHALFPINALQLKRAFLWVRRILLVLQGTVHALVVWL